MNIYVLNKDFEMTGVIDSYTSVIWTKRYFTYGDFELCIGATKNALKEIAKDFYLVREQDVKNVNNEILYFNVMVVKNIEIKTDAESGDNIILSGYSLSSICRRRVIENQTILYGLVQECIKKVIEENFINPLNPARKINNLEIDISKITDSDKLDMQVTGDNVAEWLTGICTNYGIGWDIYINMSKKQFIFYLYKGQNRSYTQDVNPYVAFSSEFDNLLTSDYKNNSDAYKNTAIVAGEGEGADRRKQVVENAAGLDRYEVYVDARDASSNNGEISAPDYNAMLVERGKEALSGLLVTESFEGELDSLATYKIGIDFDVGDLVQVTNDYGISASARITEILENEDENGINVIPTFSTMEV